MPKLCASGLKIELGDEIYRRSQIISAHLRAENLRIAHLWEKPFWAMYEKYGVAADIFIAAARARNEGKSE